MAQSRSWSTDSGILTQAWCFPEDSTIYGSSLSGLDYQYCTSTAGDASAVWISKKSTLLVSLPPFTAFQWPMSVEWQSSDLSKYDPPSAPILMASATTVYSLPSDVIAGTASARLSSAYPPTGTTAQDSQATGLSTGARKGIGIGVALLAIVAGPRGCDYDQEAKRPIEYLTRLRLRNSRTSNHHLAARPPSKRVMVKLITSGQWIWTLLDARHRRWRRVISNSPTVRRWTQG